MVKRSPIKKGLLNKTKSANKVYHTSERRVPICMGHKVIRPRDYAISILETMLLAHNRIHSSIEFTIAYTNSTEWILIDRLYY